MSDGSLLPLNASSQERAMALSTARVGAVPVGITALWNPDTCPTGLLAYLAWAFSVDEWDSAWPEEFQRQTIREAMSVQSRKGTVWSVKRVLANAGLGNVTLVEGLGSVRRDGSQKRNGFIEHGDPTQWATYRAVLDRPMTNAQAAQVRRMLQATAPARCKLLEFVFVQANNIHNGAISRNGAYNRGTA